MRIWHQVFRRGGAETSVSLPVSHRPAQWSQQLQNMTSLIVKSRSILNVPPLLRVLAGACETDLAEFENTLESWRGGLGAFGSTWKQWWGLSECQRGLCMTSGPNYMLVMILENESSRHLVCCRVFTEMSAALDASCRSAQRCQRLQIWSILSRVLWMHLNHCRWCLELLRMLWKRLRAHCKVPRWPWRFGICLAVLVRAIVVTEWFACSFWIDLHLVDVRYHDACPTTVDALLTLIFWLGQGVCRFRFSLYMQPICHL